MAFRLRPPHESTRSGTLDAVAPARAPRWKEVPVSSTLDPVKLPWPRPRVETREAFARRTVEHAFDRNPGHVWTRDGLSNWYAIPLRLVDEVVAELLAAGRIRRALGPVEGYVATKPLRAVV
jgi:hypothetical protein